MRTGALSERLTSSRGPVSHLPVDDTVGMEVFKREQDLGSIELCLPERELLALDVQHEITAGDVLHDEVDTRFSLEARVQAEQERMPLACSGHEYPLFGTGTGQTDVSIIVAARKTRGASARIYNHSPLNFIVVDDKLLLKDLDSV